MSGATAIVPDRVERVCRAGRPMVRVAAVRAFVTGATGLVGANLVAHLNDRGVEVRALLRRGSPREALDGLAYEPFEGDLSGVERLAEGMRGCAWVFHVAGCVSLWEGRRAELFDVNVGGTGRIVAAALRAGVERLVHTSSVAAIGDSGSERRPIDESAPWNFHGFAYQASKFQGEMLVRKAAREGLPAVIVNPSVVFGERDTRPSTSRVFLALRSLPAVPSVPGGVAVCDAGDVAQAHVAAAERGGIGERYILASENLGYDDVFDMATAVMGIRRPRVRIPAVAIEPVARALKRFEHLLPSEPMITGDIVRSAARWAWYDNGKAVRELGYRATPARESIEKAWRWFRDRRASA